MSMDLAKKTYSTTPDYFIAGTTVGIVTAAKEADGAVAAHNLVLLDGGKVKPLAAVDGTHALNVTGLYGIAAEDAASGEDAVVYLTGEFFAEGLAQHRYLFEVRRSNQHGKRSKYLYPALSCGGRKTGTACAYLFP